MPTNLYGYNDNYHPQNSHVLPALIRKFYEAKKNDVEEVVILGTGNPQREFLFSDDLADACYFLMQHYDDAEFVNVGTGKDITIKDLALLIKEVSGFKGKLIFDTSRPDGTPRKLMDVSKLHQMGWKHSIELAEGIRIVYADFVKNYG